MNEHDDEYQVDPEHDDIESVESDGAATDNTEVTIHAAHRNPIEAADRGVTDRRSEADAQLAPVFSGPPHGMRRSDENGRALLDALAGRASVFGFGFEPITEAIQAVAEDYLGDASGYQPSPSACDPLPEPLLDFLDDSPGITADSMLLMPSADEAVDRAIRLARRRDGDTAFRTIALVGSDHGRTGMCRTASGRPELSSGLGPMMAGFAHVPAGDLRAVREAIDEQTCCILISPIDFAAAARPIDASFLTGLRELCDQQDVLLIVDETRITLGAAGEPFTFTSIADINADMVIASAGLFGGVSGGLIVANERATGGPVTETSGHPLQAAIAAATLKSMRQQNLPQSIANAAHEIAVALAESLSEFEFIRDVHATGMTLGIEADIESSELVRAAQTQGLRIETAGETAFRLQLPLLIEDDERDDLLDKLKQAMELVQRETASLGV
jgi:acetylornithine/succinyldiaminopimelate/putrescine aminotransferase